MAAPPGEWTAELPVQRTLAEWAWMMGIALDMVESRPWIQPKRRHPQKTFVAPGLHYFLWLSGGVPQNQSPDLMGNSLRKCPQGVIVLVVPLVPTVA